MLSWFLPNINQPIHMPRPPWTSFPPRTSLPTPTPVSNLNSSIWYMRPSIILVLSIYWFSFLHTMTQYMFWLVCLLLLVTEWLLRFRKQFQYFINSSIIYLHAYLELNLLYQVPRKGNSDQFSSVTQLCPTLCNPMNRSTPGLPVHHQLPEFTQTFVHQVSDAIQPSHPLSSPSPPAPNPSRHQGLFQWVNTSHEVAKVLEFKL